MHRETTVDATAMNRARVTAWQHMQIFFSVRDLLLKWFNRYVEYHGETMFWELAKLLCYTHFPLEVSFLAQYVSSESYPGVDIFVKDTQLNPQFCCTIVIVL